MDSDVFKDLVSLCPDGIIGVNRRGIVTMFNRAAELMTGWTAQEVINKFHIDQIYQSSSIGRQIKKMLYSPEIGGLHQVTGLEVEISSRKGHAIPIRLSATLIFKDGLEDGSIGFFRDQTQRLRLEEELRRLSVTDSLTGLYNRRHFHSLLKEEVDRSQRYERPLTLVCLDLDHFKPFNDTFGHHEGDNILRLVAQCAESTLRKQDRAFRLGGDEFALLLVESDLDVGALAAERFRLYFKESWPEAMCQDTQRLKPVTISLGAAQFFSGEKPESLLKRADLAMYEAKRAGGDRTIRARSQIGADPE